MLMCALPSKNQGIVTSSRGAAHCDFCSDDLILIGHVCRALTRAAHITNP
jgi:hypothetical protein